MPAGDPDFFEADLEDGNILRSSRFHSCGYHDRLGHEQRANFLNGRGNRVAFQEDIGVEMLLEFPEGYFLLQEARKKDKTLPTSWTVRAIRYQRKGFQPSWLLTSLLEATVYPAGEIVALYHERWELELAYADEVCAPTHGPLRTK